MTVPIYPVCEFCGYEGPAAHFGDECRVALKSQLTAQAEEIERLRARVDSTYRRGFEDGLRCFAWWADGEELVGTCGQTLKGAIERIETLHNYLPPMPTTDEESSRNAKP